MNLTIELTPERIVNVIQQIPPQEKRTIMKKTVSFLFIVICGIALFPHTIPAQELQPRPIVQLIYFYPRDRAPLPDIDEKIDGLIKDVQAFYAQQMENHGFGRKTFVFETDARGKAVVHHVKGQFNHADYQNDFRKAWNEAMDGFPRLNRILLSLLDADYKGPCGRGGGNPFSYRLTARAAVSTGCFTVETIAHELGHAFGLHHDYREVGNWLPALGVRDPMITSFCAAEWLDVIPAFNAPIRSAFRTRTTIKMFPPSLVSPPNTLRLRFKVANPDGLHQVQWFTYEWGPKGRGPALWDYESLKGVSSSIVEFVTTAVKPENKTVRVNSIDVHGNAGYWMFPIDISLLRRPPEVVSIPDANLAAAVREEIGESITTHGMSILGSLSLKNRGITDLTGLEHAHNLTTLYLDGEYIGEEGYVNNNAVSDMSPLSALTQLRILYLNSNGITDVSSLAGLTQLTLLYLQGNNITDVSPLAQLTQLTLLYLQGNTISDVSPLAQLTQLTHLYLQGNPLNHASIHTHIPAMQAKGVEVGFDNKAHSALVKISGDTQEGETGTTLAKPFVVQAMDPHGTAIAGRSVTFRVLEGEGRLSATTVTTDARGRARTTLTLGAAPGINKVGVSASQITYSLSFTAIALAAPVQSAADVNSDGTVNVQDLVLVSSRLGQTGQNTADVNGDTVINVQDLVLVAAALGEGGAAAPTLHPQDLEGLTAADVQRLLTQVRQLARTDAAYLRGVAVLEQLLALLLPKKTALLPNYPNPFNPETWIPYQLSKPAEVTLHIYSVKGELVRRLALGHQPGGMYHNKSRAAYWDGRNEQAEKVASGVYFYTLSAGDFTVTQKLLIRK